MCATSIDPRKVYHSKEIAEIFPIFLERLTNDASYLRSALGIRNQSVFAELARWNKFVELFFLTFFVANSLMKAEFRSKDLSIDGSSELSYTSQRLYWI
jgi:hypothetical protein